MGLLDGSEDNDKCMGLGIVQSVDVCCRVWYILTLEAPSKLRRVTLLKGGQLELPVACLSWGVESKSVLYLSSYSKANANNVLGGGIIIEYRVGTTLFEESIQTVVLINKIMLEKLINCNTIVGLPSTGICVLLYTDCVGNNT